MRCANHSTTTFGPIVDSTVFGRWPWRESPVSGPQKEGKSKETIKFVSSTPPLLSSLPANLRYVTRSKVPIQSFQRPKRLLLAITFPRNIFSFVLVEAKAEPTLVEFSLPIFCMHLIFSPCLLPVAVTSYNYFNAKCWPARYEAVTKLYFEEFHLKM